MNLHSDQTERQAIVRKRTKKLTRRSTRAAPGSAVELGLAPTYAGCFRIRRRRAAAPNPAMPKPSKQTDEGSGTRFSAKIVPSPFTALTPYSVEPTASNSVLLSPGANELTSLNEYRMVGAPPVTGTLNIVPSF
jgi:hypothetical protein